MSGGAKEARRPDVVLLTDFDAAPEGNRPRRLFEASGFPPGWKAEVLSLTANREDDETMRRHGEERPSRWSGLRRRWRQLTSLRRVLPVLRDARFIVCLERAFFWYLVMFSRFGLFRFGGRHIVAYVDHVDPFFRRIPHLEKVSPAFKAFFLNDEQYGLALTKFSQPDRARVFPWRIDTRWYGPADVPHSHGWLIVPGNQDRCEPLVRELAALGKWKIWRIGRSAALREEYAAFAGRDDFRLSVSLTHREYLEALQGAALVLLPIRPCDNPAGTTAALEAMACRAPLLCNKSPGIDELVRSAYGWDPVPDLLVETWEAAIDDALVAFGGGGGDRLLDEARAMVLNGHAMKPDGGDWLDLWDVVEHGGPG